MEAQLTATKGLSARSLAAWMLCAKSSLPVPDSPQMSRLAFVEAYSLPISLRCCMDGEQVQISSKL